MGDPIGSARDGHRCQDPAAPSGAVGQCLRSAEQLDVDERRYSSSHFTPGPLGRKLLGAATIEDHPRALWRLISSRWHRIWPEHAGTVPADGETIGRGDWVQQFWAGADGRRLRATERSSGRSSRAAGRASVTLRLESATAVSSSPNKVDRAAGRDGRALNGLNLLLQRDVLRRNR